MTISYLKFCYCLLSPQALFSDTGYDDTDQIAKVRREVNEVKGVMTQNIGNGFRLQTLKYTLSWYEIINSAGQIKKGINIVKDYKKVTVTASLLLVIINHCVK